MKRLELEVTKREITGKKVRFLRRGGIIPCNVYGHSLKSIPVQVDARKLGYILSRTGGTDLISLKLGGAQSPTMTLIRDIQRDPMTGQPIHVDFYQVNMNEKLKAEVPLVFIGDAPILKQKNMSLIHSMTTLPIEALPNDLPHNIEVNISILTEPEQSIHIKDLNIDSKITVHADPEQLIIKVSETRKQVEEEAAVKAEAAAGEETAEKKGEEKDQKA